MFFSSTLTWGLLSEPLTSTGVEGWFNDDKTAGWCPVDCRMILPLRFQLRAGTRETHTHFWPLETVKYIYRSSEGLQNQENTTLGLQIRRHMISPSEITLIWNHEIVSLSVSSGGIKLTWDVVMSRALTGRLVLHPQFSAFCTAPLWRGEQNCSIIEII